VYEKLNKKCFCGCKTKICRKCQIVFYAHENHACDIEENNYFNKPTQTDFQYMQYAKDRIQNRINEIDRYIERLENKKKTDRDIFQEADREKFVELLGVRSGFIQAQIIIGEILIGGVK